MFAESMYPVLPDDLWSVILDFLVCTSGLRAGKELRKIARVSHLFAHRARHHPDNVVPEWRCIDCAVLLCAQSDLMRDAPFSKHARNVPHNLRGWVRPFMPHVCSWCAVKRQQIMTLRMTAEHDESDDTTSECTSDSEYDGWYPLSTLIGFFDDFDDYSDINGLNEDFLLSDDDW